MHAFCAPRRNSSARPCFSVTVKFIPVRRLAGRDIANRDCALHSPPGIVWDAYNYMSRILRRSASRFISCMYVHTVAHLCSRRPRAFYLHIASVSPTRTLPVNGTSLKKDFICLTLLTDPIFHQNTQISRVKIIFLIVIRNLIIMR